MSPVDLIVAGAGPAGLATALYGARAGLRVTVMDPRPSPIDKACGEGLMPGAVRALRDLGVDPEGYVDALTGEGISIALSCARALVDCVVVDEPAGYERRWRAATRRYRWTTSALLWGRSRPCLAPRIVPLAARLPGTFDSAVQHLAH